MFVIGRGTGSPSAVSEGPSVGKEGHEDGRLKILDFILTVDSTEQFQAGQ